MNEKTPVERLRAAAARLRDAAKNATRGPWLAYPTISPRDDDQAWTLTRPYCGIDHSSPDECEADCGVPVLTTGAEGCENDNVLESDARWMELANPLLAEPLAVWLESAAKEYLTVEWTDCPTAERALAVADVILGTPATAETGGAR